MAYLSEDKESQLRALAPAVCQTCSLLIARHSIILVEPVIQCGAPDDTRNGEVLAKLTMRLAESGRCDLAVPFERDEAAIK